MRNLFKGSKSQTQRSGTPVQAPAMLNPNMTNQPAKPLRCSDVVAAVTASGDIYAGTAGVVMQANNLKWQRSTVPFPMPVSEMVTDEGTVVPAVESGQMNFSANPIPSLLPLPYGGMSAASPVKSGRPCGYMRDGSA